MTRWPPNFWPLTFVGLFSMTRLLGLWRGTPFGFWNLRSGSAVNGFVTGLVSASDLAAPLWLQI